MVNRRSLWISCLIAMFGLANLATAQSIRHSTRLISISSHPSVTQGFCGPTNLTESGTDTVTAGNSVACNDGTAHTDNSYWRAFTLADFGITGDFNVCSVEIGVEQATSGAGQGGSQPITVNLYTSDQAFPTGFPGSLTLIGTSATTVADQALTLVNFPVTGLAVAGSQLVVEIFTPNGQGVGNLFFIGSNTDRRDEPELHLGGRLRRDDADPDRRPHPRPGHAHRHARLRNRGDRAHGDSHRARWSMRR